MILTTKDRPLLSIYCTAGFPDFQRSVEIFQALLANEDVDLIEIGMPFSDPIADGPVIQHSNQIALSQGMTMEQYFALVQALDNTRNIPIIFMGYWNNVFRFGVERFLALCVEHGISSTIIPDLPISVYKSTYTDIFAQHGLGINCLISPQSTQDTIMQSDAVSHAFIYQVSTASTTGSEVAQAKTESYLKRIADMSLTKPRLVGFGIRTSEDFHKITRYADGGIIGSAFIDTLNHSSFDSSVIGEFIQSIRHDHTT